MTTKDLLEQINVSTFIQIGGFDGKTNDPLHDFLIQSNTVKGIILEPQPDIFPLLVNTYRDKKKIIPINAAIHWQKGKQEFYSTMALAASS